MRWTAQRTHKNSDNEMLQTLIIYATHETNEDVRKDNLYKRHDRKLMEVE